VRGEEERGEGGAEMREIGFVRPGTSARINKTEGTLQTANDGEFEDGEDRAGR